MAVGMEIFSEGPSLFDCFEMLLVEKELMELTTSLCCLFMAYNFLLVSQSVSISVTVI